MRCLIALFIALAGLLIFPQAVEAQNADRPNVILIMVDDQGYGDISAHGNEVIQTPHLDALHAQSIRLTDYHTDPTCSPTRAALLTGRYSTRTGVWHTINGRSLLAPGEYTLAEYFHNNGYRTGMFGKWHLGSNAPLRPMDQGFDHCVWSPGGAVNQGANYLSNDCFDDTYKVNDQWQQFPGYHTDVWFNQAMGFIQDTDAHGDEPFFVYLPTTAVHDPWNVADEYAQPYRDAGLPEVVAKFYGMVTNVDDNVGRLRAFLEENGLAENTILIFTTDNGTAIGWSATRDEYDFFNAGMRAWKGSEYEGGHRVPFFIHWPAGGLDAGRDVDLLSQHIDVMPTLGQMCDLAPVDPDRLERGPIDGRSFRSWLYPSAEAPDPSVVRFVHSQRTENPIMWRKCAVMTERWRLVNGTELYDIAADPGQENDIAADRAEVVAELRGEYEAWWQSLSSVFDEVVRFDLGGAENPTTLMSHDWFMQGTEPSAWHHAYIMRNELRNGPFMVNVVQAGTYRITPMRWPAYVDEPSGCTSADVAVVFAESGLVAEAPFDIETDSVSFEMDLPAGPATLTATLTRADGETFGAYYVKIERIEVEQAP